MRRRLVAPALERGHALELTGHEPLPDDLRPFASEIMQTPWKAEILELADPGRGAWRFAALVEGRLEACLFLTTSEAALPAREALAAMLGGPVADAARPALLAGRGGAVIDRTICTCFSIGVTSLRAAIISEGLASIAAIGASLQAGTNCGSCIPELQEILRDTRAQP